ncbi:MAG: SgcJ/EcaC family oxidoreductase [bacterium]
MNEPKRPTVRVTHRFRASAERVFDAWLDPAHAGKFLFATPGGQMIRIDIDPRVGGQFTFVDRRDGIDVEHRGSYKEIDRPRRLVFTFAVPLYSAEQTRVVVEIEPRGSGCELTLTHERVLPEYEAQTVSGWSAILMALEATLHSLSVERDEHSSLDRIHPLNQETRPMTASADEEVIRALYQELLDGWNRQSASDMARLFIAEGLVVGFDGSETENRSAIEDAMARIFADHAPARYIGLVRAVQRLSDDAAVVHAVAGMVPRGKQELKTDRNCVQTLTLVKRDGEWGVAVFQNTPAKYDGRPEDAQRLTAELTSALEARGIAALDG